MATQTGVSIPPDGVSERLVAALWDAQRPLELPLATLDGTRLQVVYRGRRRWDRGPDFPGALIAWADGSTSSGDVEVHVQASDWYAHGHHRDPNYNGVILHVVLWGDATAATVRQDGQTVPVLALAPHLSAPLQGLTLLPEVEVPAPIPCWRCGEDGEDSEAVLGSILEGCGEERLAARAALFESNLTCQTPDQLLYRGMATALGYSQNRPPFARLADLLPIDLLVACRDAVPGDLTGVEALLMGTAGFLPSQRGLEQPVGDPHPAALELAWHSSAHKLAPGSMSAAEWEFFRVRPANFPTRRVAALAGLVNRWPPEGMAERLELLARSTEPKALPRALEGLLLEARHEGYWGLHCDFGQMLRRPSAPIGRQRAAEIAVNVFLPYLVARARVGEDAEPAERMRRAYLLYPKRGDNELTRYTARQITGAMRPRVARSACRQQGLLRIYHGFCEAKRCPECPISTAPAMAHHLQ